MKEVNLRKNKTLTTKLQTALGLITTLFHNFLCSQIKLQDTCHISRCGNKKQDGKSMLIQNVLNKMFIYKKVAA